MRRLLFFVVLATICVLLPGLATAQKRQLLPSNQGSANVPSECDDPTLGNLVGNCGFETGAYPPWVRSGDASFTDICPGPPGCAVLAGQPHSGDKFLHTGPTSSLGFFAQNIVTDPDGLYDLTFWLRNAGRPARYQVSWDGAVIEDVSDVPDFPYTQMTYGCLPASTDSTEVKLGFYNVPDFFWVDDVVVTPSDPESCVGR